MKTSTIAIYFILIIFALTQSLSANTKSEIIEYIAKGAGRQASNQLSNGNDGGGFFWILLCISIVVGVYFIFRSPHGKRRLRKKTRISKDTAGQASALPKIPDNSKQNLMTATTHASKSPAKPFLWTGGIAVAIAQLTGGDAAILLFIGLPLFIFGLCRYSQAKGYHWAWGLLGLFYLFGLLVVFLFKDKSLLTNPLSGPNPPPIQKPQSSTQLQIFVHRNEQQIGPFALGQISQMVASGLLSSEEFAWHEGLPDWVAIRTLLVAEQGAAANP